MADTSAALLPRHLEQELSQPTNATDLGKLYHIATALILHDQTAPSSIRVPTGDVVQDGLTPVDGIDLAQVEAAVVQVEVRVELEGRPGIQSKF